MPAFSGRRAPAAALSRYWTVLRLPGAVAFYLSSLPVRLGCAMLNLGLIVLVHRETGSYSQAGAVAGVLAVAAAVGGPVTARLADRYGQRRMLPPTVAVHAAALLALALAVRWHAPGWTWYALAALTGAFLPSIGSLTRARWTRIAPDPDLLATAYAIESLTDDLSFVVGPALATVAGTAAEPAIGLLATVALIVLGGAALTATTAPHAPGRGRIAGRPDGIDRWWRADRRAGRLAATGSPEVAEHPGRHTGTDARPSGDRQSAATRGEHAGQRGVLPLAVGGMRVLAVVFAGIGMVFSGLQVSLTALAAAHGVPGAAGPLYAGFGIASMVAGLAFGAVRWRGAAYRRMLVTLAGLAAGCLVLPAIDGLGVMALAIALPGLALAPTMITGNGLAERLVPRSTLTEAFAWLGAANALGIAAGSAIAGHLVDVAGPHRGFALPAIAAAGAALVVALGRRHLRVVPPRPAAHATRDLLPQGERS